MEKLRSRILNYLRDGQCFEPYLAMETADNVIDVIDEWITDLAHEYPIVDEALPNIREEMNAKTPTV